MKHMKKNKLRKILTILLAVICLLGNVQFSFATNAKTKYSNAIDLGYDISFNPSELFAGATTSFSLDIAKISAILASSGKYSDYMKQVITKECQLQKYICYSSSEDSLPDCATTFYTANIPFSRNGHNARLVLIDIGETAKDSSGAVMADFMNKEINGSVDYAKTAVLSYSEEAERIQAQIKESITDKYMREYIDCVFWVVGYDRGANVGNCLAKLLIDEYGTSCVTAYLFGSGNTDKLAKENNSSKYYSIFNIVNLDDLGTYFPLTEWGYGRWGVDVELGLPSKNRDDFKRKINNLYDEYTKNANRSKTLHLGKDYYFFSDSECNGVAIQALLHNSVYKIIDSMQAYYTKPISIKKYDSIASILFGGYSTKNIVLYDFLKDTFGIISQDELSTSQKTDYLLMGAASLKYKCDVQEVMKFVCEKGVGITDLGDVVMDFITGDSTFELHELLVNHLAESYLIWLNIDDPTLGILNYNELPDVSAKSTLESNGVSISSEDAFYDQSFVATKTEEGYTFKFTDCDGNEFRPNNTVKVSVPVPTLVSRLQFYDEENDKTKDISFDYNEQTSSIEFSTTKINGRLIITGSNLISLPQGNQIVYDGRIHTGLDISSEKYLCYGELSATEAGTYKINLSLKDPSSDVWTDGTTEDKTVNWEILKRPVTVTAGELTVTYDGKSYAPSYTSEGLVPGHSLSATVATRSKAGDYVTDGQITVSNVKIEDGNEIDVTDNYDVETISGKLHIKKRPLTIDLYEPKRAYRGKSISPDYIVTGLVEGHNIDVTITTRTNVGSYGIDNESGQYKICITGYKITDEKGKDVTNYYDVTKIEQKFDIKENVPVPQIIEGLVYNGTEQYGFSQSDDDFYELVEGVAKAIEPGEYSATLKVVDGKKWDDGSTENKTINWSIGKRPLTVTFEDKELIYDGDSHSCDYHIEGLLSKDKLVSNGESDLAKDTRSKVDTYKSKDYKYADSAKVIEKSSNIDVTEYYDISFSKWNMTIATRIVDIPEVYDLIYDGNIQGPFNGDDFYSIENGSATDSGTYTATLTLPSTEYCQWSDGTYDPKSFTWSIVARPAIVRVGDLETTYNGVSQNPDYEILGLADSHEEYVHVETRTEVGEFGPEKIYVTDTGSDKFLIKDAKGNDVTKNYDVIKEGGNLVIKKAELIIKVKNVEAVYDQQSHGANSETDYETEGLLNNHIISELSITGTATSPGLHEGILQAGGIKILNQERDNKDMTHCFDIQFIPGDLNIVMPELSSIEISEQPIRTEYTEGDLFDATGMVVIAHYVNGISEVITKYTVSKIDALSLSDTKIVISYGGKTADCNITVNPKVKATISVTGKEYKVELLDDTNSAYIILAYYSNGKLKSCKCVNMNDERELSGTLSSGDCKIFLCNPLYNPLCIPWSGLIQ